MRKFSFLKISLISGLFAFSFGLGLEKCMAVQNCTSDVDVNNQFVVCKHKCNNYCDNNQCKMHCKLGCQYFQNQCSGASTTSEGSEDDQDDKLLQDRQRI